MSLLIEPQHVPLRMDEQGVVQIGDSRVTLDILIDEFNDGSTPEDIVQDYPSLGLGDVYAVSSGRRTGGSGRRRGS